MHNKSSDDTLDVSSLPWGPWSAEDLFDAQHFDLLAELVPVNPISVPQHEFRGAVEWKGFDHLLCGPGRRRVSGDVEVQYTAAVMGKHDKNEQNFEPDRVHCKEIDRSELTDVVVQKRFPCLRWRFPMTDHVFRYGGFGNLDSQF